MKKILLAIVLTFVVLTCVSKSFAQSNPYFSEILSAITRSSPPDSFLNKIINSIGFGKEKVPVENIPVKEEIPNIYIKTEEEPKEKVVVEEEVKVVEEAVKNNTENSMIQQLISKIFGNANKNDNNLEKKEAEIENKKESDKYSEETPFYNPETGKFQDTPPKQLAIPSDSVDTHGTDATHYNGTRWQPYQNYLNPSTNQYANQPNGGYDLSLATLRPEDMRDLPKLGAGGENCGGIGAYGSLSPAVTARVKFDLNRICNAFGKRIKIIDSKRSCGGPSRHCFGEAVDYEVKTYGDRQQQALLVVAFIALGYNLGSYERGFPLHADHEEARYWKTWSRWAQINGRAALPYELAARDALSLIGLPANSANEFRAKYGHPPKQAVSQRALQYLQSVYGNDAAKFTPATQGVPSV